MWSCLDRTTYYSFVWTNTMSIKCSGVFSTPMLTVNIKKNNMHNDVNYSNWYKRWKERREANNNSLKESLKLMRSVNPLVIPRNHKVEEVLEAASMDDLQPFNDFLEVLKKPYDDKLKIIAYQSPPAPSKNAYQTFCGT